MDLQSYSLSRVAIATEKYSEMRCIYKFWMYKMTFWLCHGNVSWCQCLWWLGQHMSTWWNICNKESYVTVNLPVTLISAAAANIITIYDKQCARISLPLLFQSISTNFIDFVRIFSIFLSHLLHFRLLFALFVVPHHERYPPPIQGTERRKNAQRHLFVSIIEHG